MIMLSLIKIENVSKYLGENIIPVSVDWPGQLFIRKAITNKEQCQN